MPGIMPSDVECERRPITPGEVLLEEVLQRGSCIILTATEAGPTSLAAD